jgi:hypothetical protein
MDAPRISAAKVWQFHSWRTRLVVQDRNSAPGDNNYFDDEWAGIQNYGKFSQQFGYFEWVANLPDGQ